MIKLLIISVISFVLYSNSHAISSIKPEDIVKDSFVNVPLEKISFSDGECILFKKNNEVFWDKHETDMFKIVNIGKQFVKVNRITIFNKELQYWGYSQANSIIKFDELRDFYSTECIPENKRLSDKEIANILKSLK